MFADLMNYQFLQNAFLSGMMIGIIAPLLGVFIVVRRLSLIAEALSHVTLSGIAFSLYLSKSFGMLIDLNPLYMGMGFSVGGALLIERLRSVYKHYQELAIPIILSAGIGLGVVFISLADGFTTDLFNYLFGSVSAVSRGDVALVAIISVTVLVCVTVLYDKLLALSFDEDHAKTTGIRVKIVHFVFIVLVALAIAASMQIVGVLMVSSLMTLPVAAAMKVAKSFKQTIVLSMIYAEIAVIGGLSSSYYFDIASGGTIVMLAVLILLLNILYKKASTSLQWRGGHVR